MSSTWRSYLDYPLTQRAVTNRSGRAAPGGAAAHALQPAEEGDRLAAAGREWTACQERRRPGPLWGAGGGAVYRLGLVGALACYWQHAAGFWSHVWAVNEAILWPAFVICDLSAHIAA